MNSRLLEYFPSFQDKDSFFEKLTKDEKSWCRIGYLTIMLFACSFLYGLVMGSYNGFAQAISSGIKVPVLFVLTLLICFPAFYMIQRVLGSQLSLSNMFAILLSGFVLTASILAAFSTIILFFLIIGSPYNFVKLMHVGIFALSGLFGMKTIVDALKYSCEKRAIYPKTGVTVFRFWIIIMFFVGTQLSWNLRPFIGNKGLPFQIFREQEGNFYKALFDSLIHPFAGENQGKPAK